GRARGGGRPGRKKGRGGGGKRDAMSNPPPRSDRGGAALVASLDGAPSLARDTAQKIQTRLSLDPVLRAEAESLKRTWDLLDYLPRAEPSPNFTHRTLDKLSTRQTRKVLRKTRH